MKIHSKTKCSICKETFSNNVDLKNHIDEAISKFNDNNLEKVGSNTDDKILPEVDINELAKDLNISE